MTIDPAGDSYADRWKTGVGASAHVKIVRALQQKQFDASLVPFASLESGCDMRGFPFAPLHRISGCAFRNVDFAGADMSSIRIERCEFVNVSFERAKLTNIAEFGNRFEKCTFRSTSLKHAAIGYDGTKYSDCVFNQSKFQGASFIRPEIDRCSFDQCRLNGTDFCGASFVETSFAGELRDAWFRGGFRNPFETEHHAADRDHAWEFS